MSKKQKYSLHHLIPTAAGGPNEPINRRKINDTTHVNWHRVFNSETPVEQLIHVLTFNEQILSEQFVKALLNVLDKYVYNYYKVNTQIGSEIGSLFTLEQEYFTSKRKHGKYTKREK